MIFNIMKARALLDAIRFRGLNPIYTSVRQDPKNIGAKKPITGRGEINTFMPYAKNIRSKGEVDPRMARRVIFTLNGDKILRIFTAFTRSDQIPAEQLDAIKLGNFEGADVMLSDIRRYFGRVFSGGNLTAVVPAPSTKPLAKMLAIAIAGELNIPVIEAFSKVSKASDTFVGRRDTFDKTKLNSDVIDGNILLVDDFVTTSFTLQEMARKLYNAGASFVTAFCLLGPASKRSASHPKTLPQTHKALGLRRSQADLYQQPLPH